MWLRVSDWPLAQVLAPYQRAKRSATYFSADPLTTVRASVIVALDFPPMVVELLPDWRLLVGLFVTRSEAYGVACFVTCRGEP